MYALSAVAELLVFSGYKLVLDTSWHGYDLACNYFASTSTLNNQAFNNFNVSVESGNA